MHRWAPHAQQAAAACTAGVVLLLALALTGPSTVDLAIGTDLRHLAPAVVTGVHGVEENYGRMMRWTDGHAHVAWPAVLGVVPRRLAVSLASFPGRAGDQVALVVNGRHTVRHTLGADWDLVSIPVPTRGGDISLDVVSLAHVAPGDGRALGVRLEHVTLENGSRLDALRALSVWQMVLVVGVGAMAWLAGGWAGRPDSPRSRWAAGLLAVATLCVVALLARTTVAHVAGVIASAGAAFVLLVLLSLLRRAGLSSGQAARAAVPAVLVWLVSVLWSATYFVDVLRWDGWETVSLLERWHEGTFTLSDAWRAQNEHRPLTGRVVPVLSVWVAGWNHWHEFAALCALVAAQLVMLVWFVAGRQARTTRVEPLSIIALAVFTCTLAQWENWLRGFHVHILMGALAPAAALFVLAECRQTAGQVGLAAGLGLLGILSFGTGLLVWPLGLLVILARRGPGWALRASAWAAIAAAAVAWYAYDMPPSPHHVPLTEVLLSMRGLVRLAAGSLVALVMPLWYAPGSFMAPPRFQEMFLLALGILSVLVFIGVLVARWRQDANGEQAWLFSAVLALFGLGACVLAGIGRTAMGLHSLTASRYVAFSVCFWLGTVLLLALRVPGERRQIRLATHALVVLATLSALTAWPTAIPYMEGDALSGREGRSALRRGDLHTAAVRLYPDPSKLERMRAVLESNRLSIFRRRAR